MRIISNFKDFYDSLQDPSDKDLTYVRMTKELAPSDPISLELKQYKYQTDRFKRSSKEPLGKKIVDNYYKDKFLDKTLISQYKSCNYTGLAVLFCGRLFRGIRYSEEWLYSSVQFEKCYWDLDSFLLDHHESKKRRGWSIFGDDRAALSDLFSVTENMKLYDFHFKTGCPVITVDFSTHSYPDPACGQLCAYLNPKLSNIQFFKGMDPTYAFQELEMFIGGILSNNDKPEKVDNKYKIIAHGFDLKDSFRKGPTKKH